MSHVIQRNVCGADFAHQMEDRQPRSSETVALWRIPTTAVMPVSVASSIIRLTTCCWIRECMIPYLYVSEPLSSCTSRIFHLCLGHNQFHQRRIRTSLRTDCCLNIIFIQVVVFVIFDPTQYLKYAGGNYANQNARTSFESEATEWADYAVRSCELVQRVG